MTEIWKEVIQAFGIYAILVVALTWLLKTIFVQVLEREAAQIRQETERTSQKLIEQLKHDLAIEQETHKIRFAALQEKRADGLLKLYDGLSKLSAWVGLLQLELPFDEEAMYRMIKADFDNAREIFMEYRLYLPRELSERVWQTINVVGLPISLHKVISLQHQAEIEAKPILAVLLKLDYVELNKQVDEIAEEFRQLIGV